MGRLLLVGIQVTVLLSFAAQASAWDVRGVINGYLVEHYPWEEYELGPLKADAALPAAPPVEVVPIEPPPGRSVFLLKFPRGRDVVVETTVRAFAPVVAASRSLRKGRRLVREDLYRTLMEVDRIPKGAVRDTKAAVGKVLTRSVAANTVLRESMLEGRTKIKRGRRVLIVMESPRLVVTALGELKRDGYVGDYVTVRNLSTERKTVLKGKMIDENTVKIEY